MSDKPAPTFHDLLAAKAAADVALVEAEQAILTELLAAKDAYRDDPSDDNRERRRLAVENVRALRAVQRADRPTDRHTVGGDAFLSPEQNEG